MRRLNATTISALLVLLALLAAPAAHASPIDVIRDCSEDGSLNHKYSQNDLSGALRQLPSDLDEYTDCRSVIRNAQLSGAHKGKSASKSAAGRVNTGAPPSADEQKKLSRATDSRGSVKIGGKRLTPGAQGTPLAAAGLGGDLPTSMLLLLIGLGVAMAAAAVVAIQRRWPHAWQTAGAPFRRIAHGVRRGISRRR
jgi:hypothetical protein